MSVITVVPYEQIPPALLVKLLESFITREGTDYGEIELDMSAKVDDLRAQLSRKEIVVIFDGESETFTLITSKEARSLHLD